LGSSIHYPNYPITVKHFYRGLLFVDFTGFLTDVPLRMSLI